MRAVSSVYAALRGQSHPIATRVSSWLSGVQLAADIPIEDGEITFDDDQVIRRTLKLTVPVHDGLNRWDPGGDPAAPLSHFGQRLNVYSGYVLPDGTTEVLNLGWFLIVKWERDDEDGTVSVEADDLSQLIIDARFRAPSAPPAASTRAQEFTRLAGYCLPVRIPAGFPTGGVLPASTVWDQDRDEAIADVCASWPARWYVDDDGYATVAAPYTPVDESTPGMTLIDGSLGVIVKRERQGERGRLYNVVVVDGKVPDAGTTPWADAEIETATSPIRSTGPYGEMVRFYHSDLITSVPQAQSTADSMLVTYSRTGHSEQVGMIPDPSIELGDVAHVFTADGDAHHGRVAKMTLPLTAQGGEMRLAVSSLPLSTDTGRADADTG